MASFVIFSQIAFSKYIQGLDALGLATLDSFTSTMIPFAASSSVSSLTEEDIINLRNLRHLMLLLSTSQRSETSIVVRDS